MLLTAMEYAFALGTELIGALSDCLRDGLVVRVLETPLMVNWFLNRRAGHFAPRKAFLYPERGF